MHGVGGCFWQEAGQLLKCCFPDFRRSICHVLVDASLKKIVFVVFSRRTTGEPSPYERSLRQDLAHHPLSNGGIPKRSFPHDFLWGFTNPWLIEKQGGVQFLFVGIQATFGGTSPLRMGRVLLRPWVNLTEGYVLYHSGEDAGAAQKSSGAENGAASAQIFGAGGTGSPSDWCPLTHPFLFLVGRVRDPTKIDHRKSKGANLF